MERQTEMSMQPLVQQDQLAISLLSSFIRTITVGSGISPDLLTPSWQSARSGARGLPESIGIPPGGNFTPP